MIIENQIIKANQATFVRILLLILKNLLYFNIFLILGTVGLILFVEVKYNMNLLSIFLPFHIIYWIGFVGSFAIHEYMHCLCFRCNNVSEIEVCATFMRFSLRIRGPISPKGKIVAAFSGPCGCFIIGIVLRIVNGLFYHSSTISLLSFVYLFHLINLLPCFGDGRTIIQVALNP